MSLGSVNSTNNYLSVIGDSWLAQTNRIYQLTTGTLPYDTDYSSLLGGSISLSISSNPSRNDLENLFSQSRNIQTAIGALDSSYQGLEQVQTRIQIIGEVAGAIGEYSDLTDSQLQNINSQINYSLQEIYEIASSQSYNNVPVLDGSIQSSGFYVEIAGNNGIDITDGFNTVNPESLGLPMAGEAYITASNVDDFLTNLENAYSAVDSQKNNIVSYVDELSDSFQDLRSIILTTSNTLGTANLAPLLTPPSASNTVNNDLYLTLGNIMNNIFIDNSGYERFLQLINS